MMRMCSRSVVQLWALASLALLGCNKSEESTTPPEGGNAVATGGDAVAAVELAPVEHPSQLLPKDTALLLTTRGFARAAEIFDRPRLVSAFSARYTGIKAIMTGSVGHDLLDPAAWAEVGIDANGPLSVSFSDAHNARLTVFATIDDRDKLLAFVQGLADKSDVKLTEERHGSATIWRQAGSNGALVLRDQIAAFIVEGRPQEGFDLPLVVATMDPNLSLAAQVGYRKATGGLRDADATLFVDAGGLVEQVNEQDEARDATVQSNWAQERLVEAQKEGADKEILEDLARQAEQERQRQEFWRRREQGERALASLLFSGIEGVGMSALAKGSGPVFDGRIVADEAAYIRRLLDNREGGPRLTHSMNGTPIWCLSGRVTADAAFELLPLIAQAEGQEYPPFLGEVQGEIGLQLEADVRPVFGGDGELCIGLDAAFDPSSEHPERGIGFAAIVPLRDEGQASYLMAKMAGSGSELGRRMKKRGGGYDMPVDDWRTVHLDAVPGGLLVATDKGLAARLAAGDPGSMPSKIVPTGARGAINLPNTAASQAFDVSLMSLMFVASSASFSMPVSEVDPEVPHSKASKKARKEVEKANKALDALMRKQAAADTQRVLDITGPLGVMAMAATEDDRGFTLTGGQFIRAESMGAVVESIISGALEGSRRDPDEQQASQDAWDRKMKAESAYMEARAADAQRHEKKQGKRK